MSAEPIGYVVVEFNQASRRAERVAEDDIHTSVAFAAHSAGWYRERTAANGRREVFAVASVTLIEEAS